MKLVLLKVEDLEHSSPQELKSNLLIVRAVWKPRFLTLAIV